MSDCSHSQEGQRCLIGSPQHEGNHHHATPDSRNCFWLCDEHNADYEAAISPTVEYFNQKWREYVEKDGNPANPLAFLLWMGDVGKLLLQLQGARLGCWTPRTSDHD